MNELESVSMWFKSNKLSLNIAKTNFMTFHPLQRKIDPVELFIDSKKISTVSEAKFLGIYIDPYLIWKPHIDKLCSNISKVIGILYKVSCFVPPYIIKTLYDSLIHSRLSYCNIIWGNTYSSYLNRLHLLQKKAVRILSHSDYLAPSKPLFFIHRILNIFDIYKIHVAVFMYKCVKGLLPLAIVENLNYNNDFHSYYTRSSGKFCQNLSYNDISYRFFLNSGVKLWNSLNNNIKSAKNTITFKRRFRDHLLNNYNCS